MSDEHKVIPGKSRFQCKKGKGKHAWVFDVVHPIRHWPVRLWDRWWVEWKCANCNKKGYEFGECQSKFDPYRHTIYEQIG